MKALSGVCINSLSLNLGLQRNLLTTSLSLPRSFSTWSRVIEISTGSFIPFAGNTGFTLSAFVCRSPQIFRYSSPPIRDSVGPCSEACLQTVPKRAGREESVGRGVRETSHRRCRAYLLWTPECRQLPKCYEYLGLYVRVVGKAFYCKAGNRKCVTVGYYTAHTSFQHRCSFPLQYKEGINVVPVSQRGYGARAPPMKKKDICY